MHPPRPLGKHNASDAGAPLFERIAICRAKTAYGPHRASPRVSVSVADGKRWIHMAQGLKAACALVRRDLDSAFGAQEADAEALRLLARFLFLTREVGRDRATKLFGFTLHDIRWKCDRECRHFRP